MADHSADEKAAWMVDHLVAPMAENLADRSVDHSVAQKGARSAVLLVVYLAATLVALKAD